jgi:hypothetical protein
MGAGWTKLNPANMAEFHFDSDRKSNRFFVIVLRFEASVKMMACGWAATIAS